MTFLNQEFNVNDLPQGGGYDVLPEGWYNANIAKADLTNTKDGNGQYIKVRYDITGPTHQGRVVFGNINIRNASAKAEEIGRQQLGDLMRAIGLTKVTDTDQLLGGNVQIKLAIRPASDKYEAQNEVKGFRALGGSPPVIPTKPAAAPAPAAASSPPWMK
jgi:hypothetical protein